MAATLVVIALLIGATLRVATPIAYAALGATYSERSGVVNVGLEGIMLLGAFMGVYMSSLTNNAWLGVLGAAVMGCIAAAVLGFICISLRANQIVAGVALNILALGLTRFGLEVVWGSPGVSPSVPGLEPLQIPLLDSIPTFGHAVFRQNALVYAVIVIAIASQVVLNRTRFGRHVEAVGEEPEAAESAGLNVRRIRYGAFLLGGALAGIGGSSLSLGELSLFVAGMVAGRGFIALAANILGRWTAAGAYGASLLFGGAEALQVTLQNEGIRLPSDFLLMLPYVLTIIALAGIVGRSHAPSALARPY